MSYRPFFIPRSEKGACAAATVATLPYTVATVALSQR
jgi:hypothetical protein